MFKAKADREHDGFCALYSLGWGEMAHRRSDGSVLHVDPWALAVPLIQLLLCSPFVASPPVTSPLGSWVETYIPMQSGLTVKFIVTVWLWKMQRTTFRLEAESVLLVPSSFSLSWSMSRLTPVNHPDELSLLIARGWGNRHQCNRWRHWRNRTQTRKKEPCNIHPDFGRLIWCMFSYENIFSEKEHTAGCRPAWASVQVY